MAYMRNEVMSEWILKESYVKTGFTAQDNAMDKFSVISYEDGSEEANIYIV